MIRTRNFIYCRVMAAAALMAVSAVGSAQQPETVFVMSAVENMAAGKAILAGDYAEAASDIRMQSRIIGDAYAKATNLCVSLTLDGQIEQAESYCDRALRHSRLSTATLTSVRKSRVEVRLYRAVALSNRGVLRGISGDLDGAREDFERAEQLSSELDNASRNLAHLDTLRERVSATR